jgi:hypothetical protein
MIIVLGVMFIFGIVGVNLLKGKSFYCNTSNMIGLTPKNIEDLVLTKNDCLNYGGTWMRFHHHFDNIRNAMMQMVVMA